MTCERQRYVFFCLFINIDCGDVTLFLRTKVIICVRVIDDALFIFLATEKIQQIKKVSDSNWSSNISNREQHSCAQIKSSFHFIQNDLFKKSDGDMCQKRDRDIIDIASFSAK